MRNRWLVARSRPSVVVRSEPPGAEQNELPAVIDLAADAVEDIISRGLSAAMNKFNARPKEPKAAKNTAGGDA